jgi:hypothetical protein
VDVLFDGDFETTRSSPDNLVGIGSENNSSLSFAKLDSFSSLSDLQNDEDFMITAGSDLEDTKQSDDLESDSISCSSVITQPDVKVVTPSPPVYCIPDSSDEEDDHSDKKPAAKPSAPYVYCIADSSDDDDYHWDKKPAAKPSRVKRVLVDISDDDEDDDSNKKPAAKASRVKLPSRDDYSDKKPAAKPSRFKRVPVSSADSSSSCASSAVSANNPVYETAKKTLCKMRNHRSDEVEEALNAVGAPWGVQAACDYIQKKKKKWTDPGQVQWGMKVRKVCTE